MTRKTNCKRPGRTALKHARKSAKKVVFGSKKRKLLKRRKPAASSNRPLFEPPHPVTPQKKAFLEDDAVEPPRRLNPIKLKIHSPPDSEKEFASEVASLYIPNELQAQRSHPASPMDCMIDESPPTTSRVTMMPVNMIGSWGGKIKDLTDPANFEEYLEKDGGDEERPNKSVGCCSCTLSSCLKKYCECLKGEIACTIHCKCVKCENKFGAKPKQPPDDDLPKCECMKSGCEKNYCRCFRKGVSCTEECECTECRNVSKPDPKKSKKQKLKLEELTFPNDEYADDEDSVWHHPPRRISPRNRL